MEERLLSDDDDADIHHVLAQTILGLRQCLSFVSLVYTCSVPGQHFGCEHLCWTAVFDTSHVTMHFFHC